MAITAFGAGAFGLELRATVLCGDGGIFNPSPTGVFRRRSPKTIGFGACSMNPFKLKVPTHSQSGDIRHRDHRRATIGRAHLRVRGMGSHR